MRIPIIFLALFLVVAGCEREDAIVTYTAPKEPPEPKRERPWTLPAGWKETATTDQMQAARFELNQSLAMTLTELPPSPLLANVNRWEGQLGASPSTEETLPKVATHIDQGPLHIDLIEISGPPDKDARQSILGAIIPLGKQMWVFKIMGPAEQVASERENFRTFLRSLSLGDGSSAANAHSAPSPAASAQPSPPPAASASAGAAGGAKWKLPAGWSQDPAQRAMRVATILAGPPEQQAEVVVSKFNQGQVGDPLSNINRWRGEVRLGPTTNADDHKPEQRDIGGRNGEIYDFVGAGDAAMASRVVKISGNGEIWYFKLRGPAAAVAAQKSAFDQFLSSIQF